jgi:hypothetical protein
MQYLPDSDAREANLQIFTGLLFDSLIVAVQRSW